MSRVEAGVALSEPLNSSEITAIRPEFALHQITTYRSSCDEDFDRLAKSSIGTIGLWKRKLVNLDETALARRLMSSNLAVSSISFVGGFTCSSGEVFQEALDEAYETLFLAASLQAGCVVIAPGSRGGRYTAKHERRLVCAAIRELAFVAEELDVNLAVLGMRPEFARSWTYLHSVDDLMEILDVVNHKRVGMAFDTFHLLDDQVLQRLPDLAPKISHVQLSDRQESSPKGCLRLLPGDGNLPLAECVTQLQAEGYQGAFDVQVWSPDVWQTPADDVVQRVEEWIRSVAVEVSSTEDAAVP